MPILGVGVLAVLPGTRQVVPQAAQLVGFSVRASSVCSANSSANAALARKLSNNIRAQVSQAAGSISVSVYDRKRGITCYVNQHRRYDSASTVKATILAALLRKRGGPNGLSSYEKSQAHAMITQSDNNAASYLWGRVGRSGMQSLLNAVGMSETSLGPGGYWGLTQITAFDELKLLKMLAEHNGVLSDQSRGYQLYLMNQVISSQRWGTPAGAPRSVTTHVKNGWLPRSTHQWRVHSLGTFSSSTKDYMMAVLTQDDPSMAAGIYSIERVARTVHSTLNGGFQANRRVAQSTPDKTWEIPDEQIPNLPNVP